MPVCSLQNESQNLNVVWLKRDLRLRDHAPLAQAAQQPGRVVLLYLFEPLLLKDSHYSGRHWHFVAECLQDLHRQLQQHQPASESLCVLHGDAVMALQWLYDRARAEGVQQMRLFSHQEVGLESTWQRDRAVANWCSDKGILWQESPYAGVIRGLSHRGYWQEHWQQVMSAPVADSSLQEIPWYNARRFFTSDGTTARAQIRRITPPYQHWPVPEGISLQPGGEQQAWQTLESFFAGRGARYYRELSSPSLSIHGCSRLSAYLAWGCLSIRQVWQRLCQQQQVPGWSRVIRALGSRLHWHCHFIQKFESETRMQTEPLNRGYADYPQPFYPQGPQALPEQQQTYLKAWQTGQTGFPLVDACMRSLRATGYLNFRMRAMLVSFLCHHLQLDWRWGSPHLARCFLDFEPGIHFPQLQMQSGTTGINTPRIYNPVKQSQDQDPDGVFIRRWLPELAPLPDALVHTPWQLTPMEELMYGFYPGRDYPKPIVDPETAVRSARDRIWQWRTRPEVLQENRRILARHVRAGCTG